MESTATGQTKKNTLEPDRKETFYIAFYISQLFRPICSYMRLFLKKKGRHPQIDAALDRYLNEKQAPSDDDSKAQPDDDSEAPSDDDSE